jgi:hypothetical protein
MDMIGMSLSLEPILKPALKLKLMTICTLCQKDAQPDNKELVTGKKLFGVKQEAVCPKCKRNLIDPKDRNYKARLKRWLLKNGPG